MKNNPSDNHNQTNDDKSPLKPTEGDDNNQRTQNDSGTKKTYPDTEVPNKDEDRERAPDEITMDKPGAKKDSSKGESPDFDSTDEDKIDAERDEEELNGDGVSPGQEGITNETNSDDKDPIGDVERPAKITPHAL